MIFGVDKNPWIRIRHKQLEVSERICLSKEKKDIFSSKKHPCGTGLKLSSVKINRWKEKRDRQRKSAGVVEGWTMQRKFVCV